MKPFSALVLALIPGLLLGQPASPSKSNPESEKAVLALEKEFLAAVLQADAAGVARTLADDFYFVGSGGEPQNKAAFVGQIKSGALRMTASTMSEIAVHFTSADVVVLTYRSADKGTFKGADISGDYRWTDVVVKRDGRWQFLVGHGTAIPAPKP